MMNAHRTAALRAWWKRLSARDRLLLSLWLAGIGVAALVWGWLALQAAQGRMQALLTAERQTLGTLRVQAEELQRLKQLPAAGGNASRVMPTLLADSLSKFGVSPEIIQVAETDTAVSLQGRVPFDKWLEWTAFAQKDMRLVLQKAKVTGLDAPGFVEIQATLELRRD